MESVLYATNYLFDNHKSIGISETGLLVSIKSILNAFVNVSIDSTDNTSVSLPKLCRDIFQQLLPIKISDYNYSIPNWSRNLSKIFIDVASDELSLKDFKKYLFLHTKRLPKVHFHCFMIQLLQPQISFKNFLLLNL